MIEIRRDNDSYGFIYNIRTQEVFIANNKALDLLKKLMDSDLDVVRREYPDIAKLLGI